MCRFLERLGRHGLTLVPGRVRRRPGRRDAHHHGGHARALDEDIELAGMAIAPGTVAAASRAATALTALAGITLVVSGFALGVPALLAPGILTSTALAYVTGEVVRSYPSSVAMRRASSVLKTATGCTSLMLMSLRHEPSIPKAMKAAATRSGEFASELKAGVWNVIMGRHESFEEALHAVGDRWSRHSSELKTALNAMVAASREATEAGRRRALDRANQAIVAGTRMRIEQYALSLSTPSMVMFGIGILLPLMVGSFLPMLSWDLWSLDPGAQDTATTDLRRTALETVLLMNIAFPAIALVIAHDAVSRHPLETLGGVNHHLWLVCGAATATGAACLFGTWLLLPHLLPNHHLAPALTVASAVFPASLVLMALGGRLKNPAHSLSQKEDEDLLFRMGSRMLDGENFESALRGSASQCGRSSSGLAARLSFKAVLGNMAFDEALRDEVGTVIADNGSEALRVVHDSAYKDESAAGSLAMDLAAYLKDFSDLEQTMRNRLRPTISMMRLTAHAMAPLVLGITCVIYDSLTSIAGDAPSAMGGAWLLIVLGVFLAEINVVVVYFVWGISERGTATNPVYSMGSCIMVSEFVFLAAAVAI